MPLGDSFASVVLAVHRVVEPKPPIIYFDPRYTPLPWNMMPIPINPYHIKLSGNRDANIDVVFLANPT